MKLAGMTVPELLKLHGQTLAELRRRSVVPTANAPAGDYAEWLVAQATNGTLADPSQKDWDVTTPDGLCCRSRHAWLATRRTGRSGRCRRFDRGTSIRRCSL